MKRKESEELLQKLLAPIIDKVNSLSPREVKDFRSYLDTLLPTNCWWVLYKGKFFIVDLLKQSE
jgi:hypothetical protein